MIQPPARFGEGESAGRRPGGSAEAGFARFGGFAAGPAALSPLKVFLFSGAACGQRPFLLPPHLL